MKLYFFFIENISYKTPFCEIKLLIANLQIEESSRISSKSFSLYFFRIICI